MKFGIISLFGGFCPIASRLAVEVGDKNVQVFLPYPEYKKMWDGILPKSEDINELMKWNPDVVIFDMSGEGELADYRSEEHTSELQSQSNLVCRLLLEKKKKSY